MADTVSISPTTAWLLSAFFATSYVASLYVLPGGRLVFRAQQVEVGPNADRARVENEKWRNDPSTIKARLTGVTLATLSSLFIVYTVVTQAGSWNWGDMEAFHQTMRVLGFSVSNIPIGAWFIAPLMYLGPIYVQLLDSELPFQKNWRASSEVRFVFSNWVEFRNIVAAPITEELVYRSCIVGVMKLGGATQKEMIFLSPLWFGAAHLHHGWDLYNRFGKTRTAIKRAALTILFQQLYTSIFGWFEVFMLLRTGSILPCIFAHSFCNSYGIPLPMGAIHSRPDRRIELWAVHLTGYLAFFLSIGPLTRA